MMLALLAVGFMAAGGIAFLVAPTWGGNQGATANNGRIPNFNGKLVEYISPHMIEIPKIHAKAPIVRVGTADRELQIPLDPHIVGWWDGGAKPGRTQGHRDPRRSHQLRRRDRRARRRSARCTPGTRSSSPGATSTRR